MMIVANTIAGRISLLASKITVSFGRRSLSGRARVLLQPAEDVLDVDDRVVDQAADGDREAAERHDVDRLTHPVEHEQADRERERQRRQRDQRRAHVQQEQDQDDRDDDRRVAQRVDARCRPTAG